MAPECMAFNAAKNPTDCCKMPILIDSAITMKCETDFTKPVGPPKGKLSGINPHSLLNKFLNSFSGPPKGCCMSECVMNATGILANGKFDKAVAQKVLTQNVLAEAAWVKVINSAIDKCLVDGKIFIN